MKLKRLTPHEIIEKLSGNISELLAERQALKAHAVEVLASMIFQRKKILRFSEEEARAKARALLG